MSRFLGPIHYMMFNKIKFQEEINRTILDIGKDNGYDYIADELNKLGILEDGELENIVDTENIHGWLQNRVELVEKRFALANSLLLKEDKKLKDNILKTMFKLGESENLNIAIEEAFNIIISKFLDGMPCDRGVNLVENNENSIKFIINKDFHRKYWENLECENLYWELRNEYIRGLLYKSKISLYKIEENIYEIR